MNYIVVALGVMLSISLYFNSVLSSQKEDLEERISIYSTNKEIRNIELQECLDTNKNLDIEISRQSDRYSSFLKKYEALKAQPEKVRYETIYKIKELKSDECEDIKRGIDLLRTVRVGV